VLAALRDIYCGRITFTTTGYAETEPGRRVGVLVGVESLYGALLMALLVFVLDRLDAVATAPSNASCRTHL